MLLGAALIGVPFTSGALAKTEIIAALPEAFSGFSGWLSLAGLTTTLLMARLAYLLWRPKASRAAGRGPGLAAWAVLGIVILILPWLIAAPTVSWPDTLPFLSGLLLSALVWRYRPERLASLVGRVPPGDILHPMGRALGTLRRVMAGPWLDRTRSHSDHADPTQSRRADYLGPAKPSPAANQSRLWNWAGPLWLGLAALILLVMVLGYRTD
jgi:hypothetical protein